MCLSFVWVGGCVYVCVCGAVCTMHDAHCIACQLGPASMTHTASPANLALPCQLSILHSLCLFLSHTHMSTATQLPPSLPPSLPSSLPLASGLSPLLSLSPSFHPLLSLTHTHTHTHTGRSANVGAATAAAAAARRTRQGQDGKSACRRGRS